MHLTKGGIRLNFANEYLRIVIKRFEDIKSLGEKAIAQLAEADLHWQFNEESNSVAMIVKHLRGNMVSRWTDFLHSDGEKPNRNRDGEFVVSKISKLELRAYYDEGWSTLFQTLNNLEETDLLRTVYIARKPYLVMEVIEWQLAHYAYHIGQIVYIGKQLKNEKWENLSIPKRK